MKRCAACQSDDVRDAEETVDVRVPTASGAFVVRVSGIPAVKCGACGESLLNGPDLGRAELLPSAGGSVWHPLADLVGDKSAGVTTTAARLRALGEPRLPKQPVRLKLGLAGAK